MSAPPDPHPTLSAAALAAIYAHARRDYPNECCGIVFGPRDQPIADLAVACENIQDRLRAEDPARFMRSARTGYNLDVSDIATLQESLRGDTPARIVYHSHVNAGAYFSGADQAGALIDGRPAYPVGIDIRAGGPSGAKQFAWNLGQRRFIEVRTYA
jgi:proteasome lid subunit RPN8/RPN11